MNIHVYYTLLTTVRQSSLTQPGHWPNFVGRWFENNGFLDIVLATSEILAGQITLCLKKKRRGAAGLFIFENAVISVLFQQLAPHACVFITTRMHVCRLFFILFVIVEVTVKFFF